MGKVETLLENISNEIQTYTDVLAKVKRDVEFDLNDAFVEKALKYYKNVMLSADDDESKKKGLNVTKDDILDIMAANIALMESENYITQDDISEFEKMLLDDEFDDENPIGLIWKGKFYEGQTVKGVKALEKLYRDKKALTLSMTIASFLGFNI